MKKLVIFDVDGTLVDSQAHIMSAMQAAFDALGLPLPPRQEVLSGAGLSLELLMARLAGTEAAPDLAQAYRDAYFAQRQSNRLEDFDPLYPGTLEMLARLHGRGDLVLAVATGKSRRGLNALIAGYGLRACFASLQTADTHPSKPHPSMIQAVLAETGVPCACAVMVGDTRFDMDMAKAAGVGRIGVPWGYNRPEELEAQRLITDWDQLEAAIDALTGGTQ